MRIGIDAQLLGGHETGVELWIRQLIRALSEIDRENEYVVYAHEDAMPIETPGDWECRFSVRKASRSRLGRIMWEQFCLPKILRRDAIDVLHAPGYVMPVRAGMPTVLTVHDVIALKQPYLASRANALHYKLLLPCSLEAADLIVASSETTKRDITTVCPVPMDKVHVVPPGYDPIFAERPAHAELERVRAEHDLPERFILFVGNLEPKKNLPTLFKAIARLKAHGQWDRTLVVVGAKAWRKASALAGLSHLDVGRDVRFCGYVPRRDMPAVYTLADLFVFPSLYEGFGFPPLEAMACGTPVVCSSTPALAETVGDAALQVPPTGVRELGDAICRVLRDSSLRDALVDRGRIRVRRFTWRKTARQILNAYRLAQERD